MRKLSVYVATSSNPIEEAERYMQSVRDAGLSISFDWTVMVREAGSGSPDDPETRKAASLRDLHGVESADILWLIKPENASTGAWVELGYALALKLADNRSETKRPRIVVSGASKKCIFADLADESFTEHADALVFISNLGKGS
jgi:nucleoside 2-deoxyribosyltransferase